METHAHTERTNKNKLHTKKAMGLPMDRIQVFLLWCARQIWLHHCLVVSIIDSVWKRKKHLFIEVANVIVTFYIKLKHN